MNFTSVPNQRAFAVSRVFQRSSACRNNRTSRRAASLAFRSCICCIPTLAFAVCIVNSARAQDAEPNSTFATAQVLAGNPAGLTVVNGGLADFDVLDGAVVAHHTLVPGTVNSHNLNGLTPGGLLFAHLDNTVGPGNPDTVMRALDELGEEVGFDDDGSFFGDGLASGFAINVNADGSVHLQVTGFADYDFDGIDDFDDVPHIESGGYDLIYNADVVADVDFYRLKGLVPGSTWSAETLAALGEDPLDTILTAYDALRIAIDQNDDIDIDQDNFLSRLSGIVPAAGEIVLAVTAYPDEANVGAHSTVGPYALRLTYKAVPEPQTMTLIACSVLSVASWRGGPSRRDAVRRGRSCKAVRHFLANTNT